jgi:hypothetical protein
LVDKVVIGGQSENAGSDAERRGAASASGSATPQQE